MRGYHILLLPYLPTRLTIVTIVPLAWMLVILSTTGSVSAVDEISQYIVNCDANIDSVVLAPGDSTDGTFSISLTTTDMSAVFMGMVSSSQPPPLSTEWKSGTTFNIQAGDTQRLRFTLHVDPRAPDGVYRILFSAVGDILMRGGESVQPSRCDVEITVNVRSPEHPPPSSSIIQGYKFEDLNGNGLWDAGEPPLQGWTITLSGPESGVAVTNQNGYFRFEVETPGTYLLAEESRSGWEHTTPSPVNIRVELGQAYTVMFGNRRTTQPFTRPTIDISMDCPKKPVEVGEWFSLGLSVAVDAPTPTYIFLALRIDRQIAFVTNPIPVGGSVSLTGVTPTISFQQKGQHSLKIEVYYLSPEGFVLDGSSICNVQVVGIGTVIRILRMSPFGEEICVTRIWNGGLEMDVGLFRSRTGEPIQGQKIQLMMGENRVSEGMTGPDGLAKLRIPANMISVPGELPLQLSFEGTAEYGGSALEEKLQVYASNLLIRLRVVKGPPFGELFREGETPRIYVDGDMRIWSTSSDTIPIEVSALTNQLKIDPEFPIRQGTRMITSFEDGSKSKVVRSEDFGDSCSKEVTVLGFVQHYLTIEGGVRSEGEGWYDHGEMAQASTVCSYPDETAGRFRIREWLFDKTSMLVPPCVTGFFTTPPIKMTAPQLVIFRYVRQYTLSVEVPEGLSYEVKPESPTGDSYWDDGTRIEVSIPTEWGLETYKSRNVLVSVSVNDRQKPVNFEIQTEIVSLQLTDHTRIKAVGIRQYWVTVVRDFADEAREEVLVDNWVSMGSMLSLEPLLPPTIPGPPGTEYRRQEPETVPQEIEINQPYRLIATYGTYYQLKINSDYGNVRGEGYYRAGRTADWRVEPTVVPDRRLGFLGVVLRAQPSEGSELMYGPKLVTVEWKPDYLPLLAVIAPLISAALPCYGWPPRPPKKPPPVEPPPQRPGEPILPGRPAYQGEPMRPVRGGLGGILNSRGAKVAGTWVPVGLYIVASSVSVASGLPSESLIPLSLAGILLGGLTIAKYVTCRAAYCVIDHQWLFHRMDLNVYPKGIVRALPDDPMPLKAFAYDKHCLVHKCFCNELVSSRNLVLDAKVKYEWEIIEGEGGFIKINDGELSKKEFGEQVLYQPPDIEEPGGTKKVTIRIYAEHDDPTKPPNHEPCMIIWNIEIKRETKEEGASTEDDTEFKDPGEVRDEFVYTFTVSSKHCPETNPLPPESTQECVPEHVWKEGSSIEGKITLAPAEVAYGDYARLEAQGSDTDTLQLRCIATGDICRGSSMKELELNDLLEYEWTATKGQFPRGNKGREVVWQAPDEEGEVKIKLKVRDIGNQFDDLDKEYETVVTVRKLGIDLVKTDRAWLPDARNGTLQTPAGIYICRGGKWDYPGRKKIIRLKLKRISREKGVCMNYPINGNKNPDLFFHEEQMKAGYILMRDKTVSADCPTEILAAGDNPAHSHHYLYAVSKRRVVEAISTTRCEDYGAVGFLEAKANHCVQIPPRERNEEPCVGKICCEGSNEVKIPRDENGNDIADIAPQDAGGAAGNTDNDNNPVGDGYRGDGLTNYEEYRGFIVGDGAVAKRHVRTSVGDKDIFIYDENNLGTGFFNRSGLTIHILRDPNLYNGNRSRVINFNRGRHTGGEQHGLRLRAEALGGPRGRAIGGPGVPRQIDRVAIDTAVIAAEGIANMQNRVIAHELGHGVNIQHHGQGETHNDCGPSTERNGLQTSGDVNCVMRYTNYAMAWCHGALHDRHLTEVPALVGNTFCNSPNGTGANNAGRGHLNNATRGNCISQIRVKDW